MTAQATRALRPRAADSAPIQRITIPPRPSLAVVHALTPARSTLPFLGLVVGLLLLALGTTLLLSALMAHTAGELQRTREAASEAREASVVLQSKLDQYSSSAALSERALGLGMVPAEIPGLVDLESGAVTAGKPALPPKATAPKPGAGTQTSASPTTAPETPGTSSTPGSGAPPSTPQAPTAAAEQAP